MSTDIKFIDGLIVKAPHERAPEYVKAKLSIKRQELIDWLQKQQGDWVNADIKVSNGGKWYAAVDDWKPNQQRQTERPQQAPVSDDGFGDSEIPF